MTAPAPLPGAWAEEAPERFIVNLRGDLCHLVVDHRARPQLRTFCDVRLPRTVELTRAQPAGPKLCKTCLARLRWALNARESREARA